MYEINHLKFKMHSSVHLTFYDYKNSVWLYSATYIGKSYTINRNNMLMLYNSC